MVLKQSLCAVLSTLLLWTFLPLGASAAPVPAFQDVKATDWFYPHVVHALEQGYFAGTSPTTFSPEANMTRAMFVTTLANREKLDRSQYPGSRFQDVDPDAWYSPAVQWAASWGVATDRGDGTFTFDTPTLECFEPNVPLSRQDAAVMLFNYCKGSPRASSQDGALSSFPDSGDVALYAQNAMEWAVESGLLSGSDGKLLPRETLTRAQAAALLNNLDRSFPKEAESFLNPVQVATVEKRTFGDTTYTYTIPRVQLEGVNTAALNTEIAQTYMGILNQSINNIAVGSPPNCSEIGYYWSVYKEVLSLVTWDYLNSFYEFHVWNVDMTTGQTLDSRQLLERARTSEEAYTEAAGIALNRAFDRWLQTCSPLPAETEQELREWTLLPGNCGLDDWELSLGGSTTLPMKGNQLFLDSQGELWMIGCVWNDTGSQTRYVGLPLSLYSEPIAN
ncbi:MAG: S-layer homology domain-containing protein [Acutalibacter sp.]